ncbi:unnamed protein product, partial [Rotaria sp. Silwood2]
MDIQFIQNVIIKQLPKNLVVNLVFKHFLLCECLSFSHGKIRPNNRTEKSKFLSSLALILNGNATYTAVYVHQADKIVFIARNEPITTTDQRYFDRFFRQIRIYANLCFNEDKKTLTKDARNQLDSLIFEYNSKKIIKRFVGPKTTIIDELRKMVQWNTNEKSAFIEELRSNPDLYRLRPLMTEKIYLISKNSTEKDYVQFLFDTLEQFLVARDQLIENQLNPTDENLKLATGLVWILYDSRLFKYIPDHSNGTADNDHVGDIYKNISWKLISSIEETRPLLITPKQAFEKIFTNLYHSSNQCIRDVLENITCETFYNRHLQQMKTFDEKPIYVGHLHTEILVIDYLLKNKIVETNNSNEFEI